MFISYFMVGKLLYGIYVYKWVGLNENGDLQVYDVENNVILGFVCDYYVLVYCGMIVFIYNVLLINVLCYKGFEFLVMLILDVGYKLWLSNILSINMLNGCIIFIVKGIVDCWIQFGDVMDVLCLFFFNDMENFNIYCMELYCYLDLFVYDVLNICLSNILLVYRVLVYWCKKIFFFGVCFQFNVENVVIFVFDSKVNYDLGGKVKLNYVWGLYLNF